MVGHVPLMPEGLHHYDLHVWLWKANPLGVRANQSVRDLSGRGVLVRRSRAQMAPSEPR
jgi:hypothetical protein